MHSQWLRAAFIAAATGLSLAAAPAALAQDKTFELKISHWVPPSHPLQKALEEWGASVEKDSGGTIKYKVYPAQQLGKAFDTTTWRATASPTSPTSIQDINPVDSRSSAPANCRS